MMTENRGTRSQWLVSIASPMEPALRLKELFRRILEGARDDEAHESQAQCAMATIKEGTPSMDVLWLDQPIHETINHVILTAGTGLECTLRLDHVALCSPPTRRAGYLQQLGRALGAHFPDDSEELESIQAKVDFLRVEHAGIDINLISPRVNVPHLTAFLGLQSQGGVLHIGMAIPSMESALEACRLIGIETLGERLGALIDRGLVSEGDPLRILAQTGYAVESSLDGQGYLRQTFVFPWNTPGAPFLEFVERRGFRGYGGASSPLLLRALDLISSELAM